MCNKFYSDKFDVCLSLFSQMYHFIVFAKSVLGLDVKKTGVSAWSLMTLSVVTEWTALK